MNSTKYQKLAARTISDQMTHESKLRHALFGMASEVGELHGIFQKSYQGHPINEYHIKSELGDLMWFVAEFCTAMDWRIEDIMRMNIEKLMARYPGEGFDPDRSLNRAEGDI